MKEAKSVGTSLPPNWQGARPVDGKEAARGRVDIVRVGCSCLVVLHSTKYSSRPHASILATPFSLNARCHLRCNPKALSYFIVRIGTDPRGRANSVTCNMLLCCRQWSINFRPVCVQVADWGSGKPEDLGALQVADAGGAAPAAGRAQQQQQQQQQQADSGPSADAEAAKASPPSLFKLLAVAAQSPLVRWQLTPCGTSRAQCTPLFVAPTCLGRPPPPVLRQPAALECRAAALVHAMRC
jgi:hypothetical protein